MPHDMIVFGEDWGAHPSSSQHLVSHLAKDRGVVWVNSIGLRKPSLSVSDMSRAARKLGAAVRRKAPAASVPAPGPVVQPLALLMAESRLGRAVNRALIGGKVRQAAQGLKRPVVWAALPSAVAALGALGEHAVVYYCGDDFAALAGVDHAASQRMEAELVARADLILAASPALAARFPTHKTRLLPHGVDLDLFSTSVPRPADIPAGGPVAGFYGSLAPWIDLNLIAATAKMLPEWRFLMIGAAQADLSAIEDIGNIQRLGARPHAGLPGYAQHWDAGIIPFRDTPQIRACNPLKLREYLAAGRPVVSTDFPALDEYRHLISVANTPEAFAAALRASLTDDNAAARRAAVAAQSWAARAAEAAAWIDAL
ncbi:MAG: glycosyltransferase [Roseococcus sp.]|nr:glycosyltransferase [Roseococcus sp.]